MSNTRPFQKLPVSDLRKKRSSALLRVVGSLLGYGVLFGGALVAIGFWAYFAFTAPGPLTEAKTVIIPKGFDRASVATLLHDQGVIADAHVMSLASLIQGLRGSSLKPGEYSFPAGATAAQVYNIVASGKVVMYKLTVPEGWTSAMAVARIRANEAMAGELADVPPEGSVIANTFLFPRGRERKDLLAEMMKAQVKLVDEVWAGRKPDNIIKTKGEMVTLASIVEKETGVATERPRVAAVFLNRLKAGMRLQSDPTIIYGIAGGRGRLDRPLTKDDVEASTAYNTYKINGLPPGPIASPGKASLEAVINPAPTADLYFVADGTGGHAFAVTLEEHNANVVKWRELEAKGGVAPSANAPDSAQAEGELAELEQIAKIIQPTLPEVVVPPAPPPPPEVPAPAVPPAVPPEQTAAAEPAPAKDAIVKPVLAPAKKVVPDLAPAPETDVVQAETPAPVKAVASGPIVLVPGTIMEFGDKLIPIPALKKKP